MNGRDGPVVITSNILILMIKRLLISVTNPNSKPRKAVYVTWASLKAQESRLRSGGPSKKQCSTR